MASIADGTIPLPRVELREEDGVPLESDWHRLAMNLLIDVVIYLNRARTDYFVGGNMFIYFNEEEARNRDFRGPDFFYVEGASLNPPRPYWAVWKEGGKYPDLIIELSSPTTAVDDHTTKKDIYETVFHTHEYFCYDPVTEQLEGWRLINHSYQPIVANERGWFWCEQFGLWLGHWKGIFQGKEEVYLRFYDTQENLVPTTAEAERNRADAAEAELARLKAQRGGQGQK